MKRIFAAIKIDPSEQFLFVFNQLKLELNRDNIKWVEPRNIHITLKFFGEIEEIRIQDIIAYLEDAAHNHSSFEIELKNLGIFGSSYKPRVIWGGIEKTISLINLANDVLDRMDEIGFTRDRQNFVPHLTIGRIKNIDQKNRFQEIINKYKRKVLQVQKVNNFHLIESILRPGGPEYKMLESFELKKKRATN